MGEWLLILKVVIVGLAGYLIGSINTSILIGKFFGIDIRKHGSGNAGTTNTLRTLGKLPALLVFIGDFLKGVAACFIGKFLVGNINEVGELGLMIAGIAAIAGHNWPVYFGFKGGKGVLTTFSVIVMMDWKIALILLLIFAIIIALTRMVSLGSVIGAILFPVFSLISKFGHSRAFFFFALILGLLVVIRHKSNLKRILNGTENKLGKKK